MRVLVACEESQRVCMAFREKGHIAFSCDLKDCSGGFSQYHIKGDCWSVIENHSWDLIIAHPPCTYLSIVGAPNLVKNGVIDEVRYEKMLLARDFFMRFYNLNGVRLCIENPRPMKRCCLPPFSQSIQPFEFGDPYTKLTLLWLKGLPLLIGNNYSVNKRSAPGCVSWNLVHHDSENRSKTFYGIAKAMAEQWDF
ncbi:MAG: DNA cytosine methyltransferase [Clostridia bacterium]|nr:DNA cytosine methyltransferase [Clostridia bacterium]